MTETAKERAQRLLLEVMLIEPEDRDAHIITLSNGDDELQQTLRSMVATAEGAGSYFESVSARLGFNRVVGESPPDELASIGPYRVIEQIGRGGMGAVYLAERQDKQFEHQVAIKVLPAGFIDPEWRRRFMIEREIVAKLTHPNICRLFDGGMTEDGIPYFVMEYVDGQPIDVYCREQNASVEDILALFVDVCAAVDWAHRHLVVHRDLKPANVLVSRTGQVKLVDFGIAKLLHRTPGNDHETATGMSPMTPRYASPEVLQGRPVSTVTDVFGLGVLLYELLTQRHPFIDDKTTDIREAIGKGDPSPPSKSAPAALRNRLTGDLDQILTKALRADPAERYHSVASFANDLRCHLDHQPISARPPTLIYRFKKLYRRRRGLVWSLGLSTVLAIILVMLAATYTVATVRHAEQIADERNRADALRVVAESEAAAANRVTSFLVDLFKANIPGKDTRTTTARELLDAGAQQIAGDLDEQPVIKARLLATMSDAYVALGAFDDGLRLRTQALQVRGPTDAKTRTVAADYTALSRIWNKKGEYEKANQFALKAVEILEAEQDATDPNPLVDAYVWLAWSYYAIGQTEPANTYFQRALDIQEKQPPDSECRIGSILNGLAVLAWQGQNMNRAIDLYRRLLDTCEPIWGPNHRKLGHTLNNLALAYMALPDLEKAQQTHERALALRQTILEPDHPDVAESLNNLADVMLRLSNFQRARDLATRSLAIREKVLGPKHDYVGQALVNLGTALVGLDEPALAKPYFLRAEAIFTKKFGRDSTQVAFSLWGQARVAALVGDKRRARDLYERVIRVTTKNLGSDHADTKKARDELAELGG